MYYLISENLKEVSLKECSRAVRSGRGPYAATVTAEEFYAHRDLFDMGIDLDLNLEHPEICKAEVNFDSLTGCFSIPVRTDIFGPQQNFSFALDEHGIVFIDNSEESARTIIERIRSTKKWRIPSLERFLYDFLESIIVDDLKYLETYEKELDGLEARILAGEADENTFPRLLDIRSELLDLLTHYQQLQDMSQEFEENENEFFSEDNLRYFRMISERLTRLQGIISSLREQTNLVRDLYTSQLDVKQNRIMTILTVVSTIFMPLTLITGWYGMNFRYMPELETRWGYPVVLAVSILIAVSCLLYFKKKKWL